MLLLLGRGLAPLIGLIAPTVAPTNQLQTESGDLLMTEDARIIQI